MMLPSLEPHDWSARVHRVPSVIVVVLVGASWAAPRTPEDGTQAPVFPVETEMVVVDAVVLDSRMKPVRGLRSEDFSIMEDGKPQEIVRFRAVEVSTSPDGTLRGDSEGASPLRSFLLYFDGRNTSPPFTMRARYAAEQFLMNVAREADFVGISTGASLASCVVGGDDCVTKVGGIARSFRGEYIAPPPIRGSEQMDAEDRYWRQQETIADLLVCIREMGQHTGRKSLIFMSEDVVFDSMMSEFQDLINAARYANVAVYPVDLRGLVGPGFTAAPPPNGPRGLGTGVQPIDAGGLANDTGGRFIMSNDLKRALTDLGEESSVYYLLGYWPPKVRREGFRKIQVKVSDRHLKVRARKGYYSRRNSKQPVHP